MLGGNGDHNNGDEDDDGDEDGDEGSGTWHTGWRHPGSRRGSLLLKGQEGICSWVGDNFYFDHSLMIAGWAIIFFSILITV